MHRVAAIVLDSAEPSLLLDLARDGRLPVIAGLLERGALCPLHTSVAYRSESTETQFLTGQSPATNRYWSTVTFDPATYRCGTVGAPLRTHFYVAEEHRRAILFDLPSSIPVEGIDGPQVVGWGGHDARFHHRPTSVPPDLLGEIYSRFGSDPSVAVEFSGTWHQESYIAALADALVVAVGRRADIATWLLDRHPDWDLFAMGMTELHSAGHNFAHGVDPHHLLGTHPTAALARRRLVDVYHAVDAAVGRIVDALPGDTVVTLFSPKGMRPVRDDVASSMLLPELLHRRVFGRALVDEPKQRAWLRRGHRAVWPDPAQRAGDRLDQLVADGHLAGLKRRYHASAPAGLVRAGRRLHRTVGRTGAAPAQSELSVTDVLPDGNPPVLPGSLEWSPTMRYHSYWPAMPWFVLPTYSDGHIRLNVAGRERDGVIPVDDYDRQCDELESWLRSATDPRSGQPVVDEVLRLRAEAPLAADGPGADLVVTWRAPVDALVHPQTGCIGPFAFPRSGSHTVSGFLIATGGGVPHVTVAEHDMLDVPPTLLTLLGWQIPSRVTGEPIAEIVRSPASDSPS